MYIGERKGSLNDVSFILRFYCDYVDYVFIHSQSPEEQDEIWYGCRFRWRTYWYDIKLPFKFYYAYKNYYVFQDFESFCL